MLLALSELWLRKYGGHREDGMPGLAVLTLFKTLKPGISLLAEPHFNCFTPGMP